ncbi:hypothetical protein LCGC14_2247980, partial [marine sediment metagenome]
MRKPSMASNGGDAVNATKYKIPVKYRIPVDVTDDDWTAIATEADSVHLSMGEYLVMTHRAFVQAARADLTETLCEIEDLTGDPPASISAQLRHLRKERFGAHTVERR